MMCKLRSTLALERTLHVYILALFNLTTVIRKIEYESHEEGDGKKRSSGIKENYALYMSGAGQQFWCSSYL